MAADSLPAYPPMFSLKGEPIPISPDFSAALASVVVEWTRVEIGIRQDLESMRRYPGVKCLSEEIPFGFEKQVKLWRRTVQHLYASIPSYLQFADHIRDMASDLGPKRNLLMHGLWNIAGADDQGIWAVSNYRPRKRGYEIHRSNVSLAQLQGTADQIRKLSGDIAGFAASKMLHEHKGIITFSRS